MHVTVHPLNSLSMLVAGLMASRKPRHVYSGRRRRASTTPGEPIELPALPVSLARSHGAGARTACSRARPPPRDGLLAPGPAVTGHTADGDGPLVKQFYYYYSSLPPSTPPGDGAGYAYSSRPRRLRRTGAGAGTWEGKAGYTGCAGYPHMTHLPMWAGMQEYVGSRRCPTQRVSQVAHAVCILSWNR